MLAGAWLLLVLVTLGSTGVGTVAAQNEVRTSIGTLSDTQKVTARFVAIIAANGRAVLYLVSDNPEWNWRYSRRFVGQAAGIRLFARSDEGTEATAFLWGNRLVGTLGTIGWSGTLIARHTGGLCQGRSGDEIHLVLVAPDNAWIGTTWSSTGQLVRTWDTSAGSVERLSDAVIRARRQRVRIPGTQSDRTRLVRGLGQCAVSEVRARRGSTPGAPRVAPAAG